MLLECPCDAEKNAACHWKHSSVVLGTLHKLHNLALLSCELFAIATAFKAGFLQPYP